MFQRYTLLLFFICCLLNQSTQVHAQSNPQALASGIGINRILTIANGAIRVSRNPIDSLLYYTDTQGNIRVVIRPLAGVPYDSLVFTAMDHGVEYVQGMDIHDSVFYISGNNGSATALTTGIIVKGVLQTNGTRIWSTLMETVPYKTADYFDHLFSGMTISPDGDSLVICSGARGDHGEIQTRYGAYPGVRNVPLTARVYILPTHDSTTITLLDDSMWLDTSGYVFANGIRNTFDMAYDADGHLFGVENSGDRDHNEEMNWLQKGHHYGFPWKMGDTYNPQQFASFDPNADSLINHFSRSWRQGFWSNDPTYPQIPPATILDSPVQNYGPDCDKFRDTINGNVLDASDLGITMGTFTAHRSPLGLVFDRDQILHPDYRGDGFMLSWTKGYDSCGCTVTPDTAIGPFVDPSEDLVHLDMNYDSTLQNFTLHATRIVSEFSHPVDDAIFGNSIYVLENGYGGTSGLYEITLPYPPDCLPSVNSYVPNPCTPSINYIYVDTFGIVPDQIDIYDSNGINIHSVSLSSGADTLHNLPVGFYYVLMHDAGTCSDSITFTFADSVHFDNINVYPTNCIGCSDGSVAYTTSGGISPYSFTLSPPTFTTSADSISGLQPGNYLLCVTDAPGCTFCDSITIAEDPTGIHALEQNFSMKINPNPASDEITLQLNSRSNTNFIVQIRDKQGKTVMEKSVENNNEPKQLIQISISTLPAGVYSLSCEQDGKIFSSKFVVVE